MHCMYTLTSYILSKSQRTSKNIENRFTRFMESPARGHTIESAFPRFWLALGSSPIFESGFIFWSPISLPCSIESLHLVRFHPCPVPLPLLVNLLSQSLLPSHICASSDCYVRWPYCGKVCLPSALFLCLMLPSSLLFTSAPSGTLHHIRSLLERSNVCPVCTCTYPAAPLYCIRICALSVHRIDYAAHVHSFLLVPPVNWFIPHFSQACWVGLEHACIFAMPTPHTTVKFAGS